MKTMHFWIFTLTIRPAQGWSAFLNWDLDLGRLAISVCWWRPHRIGIGIIDPDRPASTPYRTYWRLLNR